MSSSEYDSSTDDDDSRTPAPTQAALSSIPTGPRSLAELLAEAKASQKVDFSDAHAEASKGFRSGKKRTGKGAGKGAGKAKPQNSKKKGKSSQSESPDLRFGRLVVIVDGIKIVTKGIRAPSAHDFLAWESVGFGASKLDAEGLFIPAGSTTSDIVKILKKYVPIVFSAIDLATAGELANLECPIFLLQKDHRALHRIKKDYPTFADFDAVCSGSNVPWRRRILWIGTKVNLKADLDALLGHGSSAVESAGEDASSSGDSSKNDVGSDSDSDLYVSNAAGSKRSREDMPVTRNAKRQKARAPSPVISIKDTDDESSTTPIASGSGHGQSNAGVHVPQSTAPGAGFESPSKTSAFDKWFEI